MRQKIAFGIDFMLVMDAPHNRPVDNVQTRERRKFPHVVTNQVGNKSSVRFGGLGWKRLLGSNKLTFWPSIRKSRNTKKLGDMREGADVIVPEIARA